jgi:hypothetical protein
MFDLSAHLHRARPLPLLTTDVAYVMHASLFYGSLRKPQPGDLRYQAAPLRAPSYTKRQVALASAAAGQEKELLRYYADVFKAAQQHRQDLKAISHYFWLRPVLRDKDKTVVSFPWYDTYPEAAGLLRALQVDGDNQTLFDDLDQGWQVAIYATADEIYLAEGSDDDNEPGKIYRISRPRLRVLAAETLVLLQKQLAYLVAQTGQNPWRYTP